MNEPMSVLEMGILGGQVNENLKFVLFVLVE
jgi:hypothetical protein